MARRTKTWAEIKKAIEEGLENIDSLYASPYINYRGDVIGLEKRKITEVITKILLEPDNFNKFDKIKRVKRLSYKRDTHDGSTQEDPSNRIEERFALALYNFSHGKPGSVGPLGEILDYQVPLKGRQGDKQVGKIDLISFNPADKEGKTLFLIELKKMKSKETLLRCILEVATYIRQIEPNIICGEYCKEYEPSADIHVHPAILVFEDSCQLREIENLKNTPQLLNLIKSLSIRFFVVGPSNIEFQSDHVKKPQLLSSPTIREVDINKPQTEDCRSCLPLRGVD